MKLVWSTYLELFVCWQLFDNTTYTYTYLLADPESKEAVIIDPVIELVDRDLRIIKDFDLKLRYACETSFVCLI